MLVQDYYKNDAKEIYSNVSGKDFYEHQLCPISYSIVQTRHKTKPELANGDDYQITGIPGRAVGLKKLKRLLIDFNYKTTI